MTPSPSTASPGPEQLQRALAQLPPRAVQTLTFRCLEGRPAAECAALYGIGPAQWEVLFFEAARTLAEQTVPTPQLATASPLPDPVRQQLAARLQAELANPGPDPLPATIATQALILHREEVHRLIAEAERAAASSPARVREGWLRRLAVVLIIALSLFVWLRERNQPPAPAPSQFPLPPPKVG